MAPNEDRVFSPTKELKNYAEKCLVCKTFSPYCDNVCLTCYIIKEITRRRSAITDTQVTEIVHAATTSSIKHSQEKQITSLCYCEKRVVKGVVCYNCKTVFHFKCTNVSPKQKLWFCLNCCQEETPKGKQCRL